MSSGDEGPLAQAKAGPVPRALSGVLVAVLASRTAAKVCASILAQFGADVGEVSMREGAEPIAVAESEFLKAADVLVVSSDVDGDVFAAFAFKPSASQILCDVTATGSGTDASPMMDEAEIQALSGILATTGFGDRAPVLIPCPIVNYLAGLHATAGVLLALQAFDKTGNGQRVDACLYDAAFAATSSFMTKVLTSSGPAKTRRIGNRHALSAPWNVYRAVDGWIMICTGSDLQWRRLCEAMGRPQLAEDHRFSMSKSRVACVDEVDREVETWTQARTIDACVSALEPFTIPCGPVATVDGFPREKNLQYRGMIIAGSPDTDGHPVAASPFSLSESPGVAGLKPTMLHEGDAARYFSPRAGRRDRQPSHAATSMTVLDGLRVIEIGHYTTAPVATKTFGAFGADVIKIEPPEGEAARAWTPFDRGQSTFFTLSNSDKRCITIDLRSEAGRRELQALVDTADVLIENLKPGTLEKLGFSWEAMRARNPRLVYCAISGFGARSLYAGRPAFDTVVQAMGGLMDLVQDGGVPLKTGISAADVLGAAVSVVAVLAALAYRDRAGVGQQIDLSMQDIVAWTTEPVWTRKADPSARDVVACRDGFVLMRDQPGLCSRDAMMSALAERDQEEAVAWLAQQDVIAVPILLPEDVIKAERTVRRALVMRVQDERGEWPVLVPPVRLSATPGRVTTPAPALGRNNADKQWRDASNALAS